MQNKWITLHTERNNTDFGLGYKQISASFSVAFFVLLGVQQEELH